MENETLESTAPEEGQPVAEAVADVPSAEPGFGDGGSAPEEGQPAPRLYAGKYKSPEELEQSYLDSQREASRMAGELAAYKRAQAPAEHTADPVASTIEKHEAERNKWQAYAEREDLPWNERAKALSQVSRYDREIGKLEAQREWQSTSTRQSATQTLESDAEAVFQTYEKDLSTPGSQLYAMADQRYRQMLNAGYPAGVASKADAVLWAAHKTGADRTRVVQADRKGLLDNLNKQARSAQKAGAGSATVAKSGGVTPQQIMAMDPAAFAKWERENVLGV